MKPSAPGRDPSTAAQTASLLKRLPGRDLRAQVARSPISERCQQALPLIVEMSSWCQSLEFRTWDLENLIDWIPSNPLPSWCDLGHLWEPSLRMVRLAPSSDKAHPFLSRRFVSTLSSALCMSAMCLHCRHLRDSSASVTSSTAPGMRVMVTGRTGDQELHPAIGREGMTNLSFNLDLCMVET